MDLLRHNKSFPNSSGSTERPNTLGVQDAGADIFDLDDFDSPIELAAIDAGRDLAKLRTIGFSQNTLASLPVNRALGNASASAARSPSPHERPRSTLPIVASSSGAADDRELFNGAAAAVDARSSAVDDHMKRSQTRPLSSSVAGDPSPARPRARTFAKRSIDENPNLRRLEELYRDIAAQKEVTARLGSSLRLHADEFDDSLSGRSQSLSSTPPLFFPLEPSHSPSPSTSHSRDSPIQFIAPRSPPLAGSASVPAVAMPPSSCPRSGSASASSPDSPLGSSLVRPGGPTHASGRRPSIDSPSPLAAPPFESRTLRLSDAASKHSASSREPNCEYV